MCCSTRRTIAGIGAPFCAQRRLVCMSSSTLSSAKSLRRLRLRSVCRPSQRSSPYFSLLLRSRTYHAFQYACLFGPIGTHSLATVYQTPCTVILFPQKANATWNQIGFWLSVLVYTNMQWSPSCQRVSGFITWFFITEQLVTAFFSARQNRFSRDDNAPWQILWQWSGREEDYAD